MFLASFPAGPWQANCYVVATAGSHECVIVDPGMDADEGVQGLLREHRLTPSGILLTHGHFDHVASAASLADHFGVPAWIHSADRHLLTDPAAGLSPDGAALVRQVLTEPLAEPSDLRLLDGQVRLDLAGLRFGLTHAPGHTAGCVLFDLDYPGHHEVATVVFTGDVLFAGSIGRTDLPGGDADTMRATLRGPVLALPDTAAVLPGHGPQSTMRRERARNPYLQPAFLRNR